MKKTKYRILGTNGYILLWKPRHPLAMKNGYVYEHRYVLSKKLGRLFRRGEQSHHKNRIKADNRPSNLEVKNIRRHASLHHRRRNDLRRIGEPNRLIKCRCGCGQLLRKYDVSGRPRKFVTGHNTNSANSPSIRGPVLELLASGPKATCSLKDAIYGRSPESKNLSTVLSQLKKEGLIENPRYGLWSTVVSRATPSTRCKASSR